MDITVINWRDEAMCSVNNVSGVNGFMVRRDPHRAELLCVGTILISSSYTLTFGLFHFAYQNPTKENSRHIVGFV